MIKVLRRCLLTCFKPTLTLAGEPMIITWGCFPFLWMTISVQLLDITTNNMGK
jgi:hypothetical protein